MSEWVGFFAIGDKHDATEEISKNLGKYRALTIGDRAKEFPFLVIPLKDIKFLKFFPDQKVWGIGFYSDMNVILVPEFWKTPEVDTILLKFEELSL